MRGCDTAAPRRGRAFPHAWGSGGLAYSSRVTDEAADREGEVWYEPLARPDPSRAERSFIDGDHVIVLRTMPAAGPVWLDYGPNDGFFAALAAAAIMLGTERIDRRWKVVTFRARRRIPALPRVIAVDFVADEDAANSLRAQTLAAWRPGRSGDMAPIGALARGRMRRGR